MDNKNLKGIFFSGTSDLEFVFIHGYTGSITDFADLPHILHQEFNADVWFPMLPGHGTSIDDLQGLSLDDLIHEVEGHVRESVRKGKKVILVGVSFGAQVALYLASAHAVAAVISVAITHKLKFPLTIPGIGAISFFKRKWKKIFTAEELRLRADAIYYRDMLFDGFFISRKLRTLVEAGAKRIYMPILFIHSSHEQLGDSKAVSELSRNLSSKRIIIRLIQNGSHNMFYSSVKHTIAGETISFIRNLSNVADATNIGCEKATAIVAAYNEAPRIGSVIGTLLKTPLIDEIIVVDDGSDDNTQEVLRMFPQVHYLRNHVNLGKGESMDKGVRAAKNDVIFFCDADLVGFKPEHAEAIVAPVIEGSYDMFIGMRGNLMQRAVRAWGLNSGERALRKKTWFELPQRFKHRYRIEVALNNHVRFHSLRGFGWKVLDYSQTLKEKKYGFLVGTFLRWWMNADIIFFYAAKLFSEKRLAKQNVSEAVSGRNFMPAVHDKDSL